MIEKEMVLCIPKDRLPAEWTRERTRFSTDLDTFCSACETAGYTFEKRAAVESDPSFKQVIPYIVFQTADREQMAIYRRTGSEKRLHDLWSVGIGGHINPVDQSGKTASFKQILLSGMARELGEEIIDPPHDSPSQFMGIINENETDVGKVHMGAVFRLLITRPERVRPGAELTDFKWVASNTVPQYTLELWSQLALSLVS